ncbi:unnamed protein product [Lampetra planeri]
MTAHPTERKAKVRKATDSGNPADAKGVVVQSGRECPQRLFLCPSRHFTVREEAVLKGRPVAARRQKFFKDEQSRVDGWHASHRQMFPVTFGGNRATVSQQNGGPLQQSHRR